MPWVAAHAAQAYLRAVNLHAPHSPDTLGDAIERVVARIIREGHYASRDDVLRAAVLSLENLIAHDAAADAVREGPDLGDDREAVRAGLADIEAGRVVDGEEMFDRLITKYGGDPRS